MAESTKRLISIGSAAQQLGVSVFTVRRLIKAGQLQAVRVSRRVLVSQSEIDRVCEEGCTGNFASATRTGDCAQPNVDRHSEALKS